MTMILDTLCNRTDFVVDNVLHHGYLYTGNVLVNSSSDLTGLSSLNYYQPGALAHTAGWADVWELGADGTTWTKL